MNRYQPQLPKTALALMAGTFSAITLSALVLVPAAFDARIDAGTAMAKAPIEVTISPARVDVVAVREPNVAWALEENGKPNCDNSKS